MKAVTKCKKNLPLPYPYFFLWLFAILGVCFYFYWDRPISEWVQQMPPIVSSIGYVISALSNPGLSMLILPLLLFISLVWWQKKPLANLFLLMTITVNATHFLTTPIKMFFGRYRPDLWLSQHLYGFDFLVYKDIEMSFPSGHAMTIASILFSIACVYPKKFPLLLVLTILLSFCRVIVDQHYVSDILASMLFTFFMSQWIYLGLKRAKVSF